MKQFYAKTIVHDFKNELWLKLWRAFISSNVKLT